MVSMVTALLNKCASNVGHMEKFGSKKRVTIVSDGGLAKNIGTFGWKLIGMQ
jgi:hypothetical protein